MTTYDKESEFEEALCELLPQKRSKFDSKRKLTGQKR